MTQTGESIGSENHALISDVTKCYVFDKYSECYFYGLDGWKNINWGNDKTLAELMPPDMAIKMLVELKGRNDNCDLWINVL